MAKQATQAKRRTFLKTTAGIATTGLVAGCTGTNSGGEPDNQQTGEQPAETSMKSLEQRAKQEGEVVVGQPQSGFQDFYNNFESKTGIKTSLVRRSGRKLINKIIQEYQANKLTIDTVMTGGQIYAINEMIEKGILKELPEGILKGTQAQLVQASEETLAAPFVQRSLSMLYNPNVVDQPPQNLEELFSGNWKGQVTVDVRDAELLLVARATFDSEDGAEEFVKNIGDIATWRSSHFDAGKQIARGEVPMGITYPKYTNYPWGQGKLKIAEINGFPKLAEQVAAGVLDNSPHPDAGAYLLKYILENSKEYYNDAVGFVYTPKEAKQAGFWWPNFKMVETTDPEKVDTKWKQLTGLNAN